MADSEQAFQEAREAWRAALRGHVLAPPDAGFSERLAALAAAEAVAELDRVSEGRSLRAVAHAYAELGDVADQLARAVEREDRAPGLLPPAVRRRRKSA
jgi:hypothetical protein